MNKWLSVNNHLTRYILNPIERKRIRITLGIVASLCFAAVVFISYFYKLWLIQNMHMYKGVFKQLGSIGRIGFFVTLSIYPIFLVVKWKSLKKISFGGFELQGLVRFIWKLVRQWHVPIAILATGISFLHGYMAILKGVKWNFTYFSGVLTILVLLLLMFMGLKRYKKNDQRWHFKLAICFLILFMLHATFT